MNFENLKEKLFTDIRYQLGLGLIIILISTFFILSSFLFPSSSKPSNPCYNTNLTIWLPEFIDSQEFNSIISRYATRYCLSLEIVNKNSEDLEKEFILSLAENSQPDIILARTDFVYRNKKFLYNLGKESRNFNYFFTDENLDYGYPAFIDTLVLYFNRRIFDFLKIESPQTIDELNDYLEKVNQYDHKNFYLIGLGFSQVKNKKEIILVLQSILRKPIDQVIDYYFNFNKKGGIFFQDFQSDLSLFANEKLGSFIGFYRDKKEFMRINPRITYEISRNPLETFPPSAKNFVEVYYFVIPERSKKINISLEFLNWLLTSAYQEFVDNYDLVPNLKNVKLSEEKRFFLDSTKYGSSYLEIISQDDYKKFDRILEIWELDFRDGRKELIRSGLKF